MEAIKVKSFRTDYTTLARRLLAINGYSKENSYNPHNVKAYVLAHEFAVFCIAVGSCLQEALDYAVDNDCMDCMLVEDYDYSELDNDCFCGDVSFLGNASEPFDITYLAVVSEIKQYN